MTVDFRNVAFHDALGENVADLRLATNVVEQPLVDVTAQDQQARGPSPGRAGCGVLTELRRATPLDPTSLVYVGGFKVV